MNLQKVDGWLALLLPKQCALCGLTSDTHNICVACLADLPWIEQPCKRCGAPLPDAYDGHVCGRCDLDPGGLCELRAALVYEFPVNRLVAQAKFQQKPDSARVLGECLAVALLRWGAERPDIIVPVPLHKRRLAVRGFNQAQEIARAVSELMNVRQVKNACYRIVDTRPQSDLSAAKRRRNVQDAFTVSSVLSGRHVGIVDDVVTTGCTIVALADAILGAGALSVRAWVVARADSGHAKRVVE